jgi:hypothetical protein
VNEIFQYQAFADPFGARIVEPPIEEGTDFEWYVPPIDVHWPIPETQVGWYTGLVFALPDQPVQLDQWYREAVWWIPPIHQTEEGFFSFNPEPIPNPAAPDNAAPIFPDFIFTIPPTMEGWFTSPVYPIPNVGDAFFVPLIGYHHDPALVRNAINMMATIWNSMMRRGRLKFYGAGDWDIVIDYDDVVQALGFVPEVGSPAPAPDPGDPGGGAITGNIATLTNNGGWLQVATTAPHGVSAGQIVRLAGTSVPAYHGDWTVLTIDSTTQFTVQRLYTIVGAGGTYTVVG